MGGFFDRMGMMEGLERRMLRAAGDIDTTFGVNGQIAMDLGSGATDSVIIPAGGDQFIAYNGAQLFKLDAAGGAVTSFAHQGHTDVGELSPKLVRLVAGGKILVWDSRFDQGDGRLVRLNADGTFDQSFGDGGAMTLPGVYILEIAQQSNGKVLVVDASKQAVIRLNADGSRDSSFHEFEFTWFSARTPLLIQEDDKIVIGGLLEYQEQRASVIRLNANGTIDTTFGDGGLIRSDVGGTISEMAFVPGGDGSFVALDNSHNLRKFNPSGAHDATFESSAGVGAARTGLPENEFGHLVLMPGGKFIVWNEDGMMRLKADGKRDRSFGPLLSGFLAPLFTGAAATSSGDIMTGFRHVFAFQHAPESGIRKISGSGSTPAMIGVEGSVLNVTGTDGNDVIWVLTTNRPGIVEVQMSSGWNRVFDRGGITQVSVAAMGGNDGVYVQSLVELPVSVSGDNGNDTIIAQAGNDSLSGNAGNDKISGGDGLDRIAGNGGRDRLDGGADQDRVFGGAGGDFLASFIDDDVLKGEAGDDIITSAGGAGCHISGGDGNDLIFAANTLQEHVHGDAGTDSVQRDASDILDAVENVTTG